MKKYQWYIFSGASIFLALVFGAFARVRRNWCLGIYPEMQGFFSGCMQRAGVWMVLGFVLFIMAVVFLILGILEKSK